MKRRFLAALVLLMATISIPFLTDFLTNSEARDLKRILKEEGYDILVTDIPDTNAFSANTACEIRFEPGYGSLQILRYSSPKKREAGMRQWLEFWETPQNVTAQATLYSLYETENCLIWYQPGSVPDENPVQDYLENASFHTYSYITYPEAPTAQIEVMDILHDLQELGYALSGVTTAENGTEEYTEIAGQAAFGAESICAAEVEPGEGKILFHAYSSPSLRENGAKERRDLYALASLAAGVEFYETEYTLITFYSPPEQAEYGDPVREYLLRRMEETLQK